MSSFYFEIEASGIYSVTAPTLEVLLDGIVVSSVQVETGPDRYVFLLDYSGDFPTSLALRFNDGSGEGGRSVDLHSVWINGWKVSPAYLGALSLLNGESSAVNTGATAHLYGRQEPVVSDIGTETQTGTSGDDRIAVPSTPPAPGDPDIINAGDGNDRVIGSNNVNGNAIFGGIGNDTLFGGAANDIIVGGAGDDMITGGAGDDILHGGADNDTIQGGDGNDVINGGAGDDFLSGGAGDDILFGEDGNDTILGGAGADLIFGDDGDDIISGGAGNDEIYGGLGHDTLQGDGGDDVIYGEAGNDIINGGAGNDTLYGNNGNDTLIGGIGVDALYGGAGDDIISLANGHFAAGEIIDGGADNDAIILTNATTVDFTTGTISGVETLTGSSGDDMVTLSASQWAGFVTLIDLAGGTDTLNVVATGNIVASGVPAGIANVETGNLSGTGGNDVVTMTGAQLNAIIIGAGTINTGAGTDTLNLTSTSTDLNALGATDASIQGLEAISFATAGSGITLTLSGQTEAFTITGSGFADTITLGAGANIVDAGAGNDTINLGDGHWTAGASITGGTGTDSIVLTTTTGSTSVDFTTGTLASVETLTGSSGNDTVTILATHAAGMFSTINLGSGTSDILNVRVVGTMDISASTLATISGTEIGSLLGSAGDDTITLTGAQLNAIIIGTGRIDLGGGTDTINLTSTSTDLNTLGATNSLISGVEAISAATAAAAVTINLAGQSENFTITGSNQNDTLTGGDGYDTIYGGSGNDTINGGSGADRLYGGAGDDVIYGGGADVTVISQATATTVRIDISSVLHNNNQAATLTLSLSFDGGSTYNNYVFNFNEGPNINPTQNNIRAAINGTTGYSAVKITNQTFDITIDPNGYYGPLVQSATYNAANDPNRNVFSSIQTQGVDAVLDIGGYNVLSGGAGTDTLYGGDDIDVFLFETSTLGTNDTIHGYSVTDLDKLDISDLLTGFTEGSSDPDDFARFTVSGADLLFAVDTNGTTGEASFSTIATLAGMGASGLTIQDLYDAGLLVMV